MFINVAQRPTNMTNFSGHCNRKLPGRGQSDLPSPLFRNINSLHGCHTTRPQCRKTRIDSIQRLFQLSERVDPPFIDPPTPGFRIHRSARQISARPIPPSSTLREARVPVPHPVHKHHQSVRDPRDVVPAKVLRRRRAQTTCEQWPRFVRDLRKRGNLQQLPRHDRDGDAARPRGEGAGDLPLPRSLGGPDDELADCAGALGMQGHQP